MPSFLWMCCQEHGHKIHVKQAVSCKLVCSPLFFHCAAGTTSAISASIFFFCNQEVEGGGDSADEGKQVSV